MLFICKIDYSRIFQRSGILALIYLGFLILQDTGFLRFFSTATISYLLSIPIFCGLLYKFRKRNWYHLLIPAGFMLVSILLMHYLWLFVSYKIVLVFTSAILVTVAICKEWYPIRKKIFLPILWCGIIGIPSLFLLMPYKFPNLFPPYVSARISNWIYPFENMYQSMVHAVMTRSSLFGHSATLVMDFNSLISDYMVVNITARYGQVLTCILAVLFTAFCVRLFYLALHQKNQLGMILGLGCSLALTVEVFEIFSYEPWYASNDIWISPTVFLRWKCYDHFLYICWDFIEYLPKSELNRRNQTKTVSYSSENRTGITGKTYYCYSFS